MEEKYYIELNNFNEVLMLRMSLWIRKEQIKESLSGGKVSRNDRLVKESYLEFLTRMHDNLKSVEEFENIHHD